jgi:hypothetical protein
MITESELQEVKFYSGIMGSIVAKYGDDHVYQRPSHVPPHGVDRVPVNGCVYINAQDRPDCLIAKIFVAAGLYTIEELKAFEGDGAVLLAKRKGLNSYTQLLLATAQTWQDMGKPWGRGMTHAKSAVLGEILYNAPSGERSYDITNV